MCSQKSTHFLYGNQWQLIFSNVFIRYFEVVSAFPPCLLISLCRKIDRIKAAFELQTPNKKRLLVIIVGVLMSAGECKLFVYITNRGKLLTNGRF